MLLDNEDLIYMSPHLVNLDEQDGSGDMYAFGIILWEISNAVVKGSFFPRVKYQEDIKNRSVNILILHLTFKYTFVLQTEI